MTVRVLHINTENGWRGGERQVFLFIKYSGNIVANHLLCRKSGALFKKMKLSDFSGVSVNTSKPIALFSALWILWYCKKNNIDVVHCHTPKAQTLGVLSKWFGNKSKIIVSKRTVFPVRKNLFTRLKYQSTDLIICVSKEVEKVIHTAVLNSRKVVINSGFELHSTITPMSIAKACPTLEGKRLIGYVAAITKEKDPDTFLEVAAEMTQKYADVAFIWLGDGALKSRVQSRIDELGLTEKVLLAGFKEDIMAWIKMLDLLFFPSTSEGFPTTILDAFQCQVPVVASAVGGITELIENGSNGLLAPVGNVAEFSDSISMILEDEALAHHLIQNATSSIEQFNIKEISKTLVKTYQDVLR